jgi:hypothetical protein
MKGGRIALALFLGLWASGPSAQVSPQQPTPLEPPNLDQFVRWGPFRVRPAVNLSRIGYDNNVFYETPTQPAVGDYTATVSPRIDAVVLLGHRGFVTLKERFDYTAYLHYTDQNYYNSIGSVRATFPFGNVGVYADFGFDAVRERPYYQFDQRAQRLDRKYGAGFIVQAGWRTDLEIGALLDNVANSDPDFTPSLTSNPPVLTDPRAAQLNRLERGTRLRARYLAFGRTRFTLEVGQRNIDFDNPTLNGRVPTRNASERRFLPGVEFGQGGRLTGSVRLGHSWLSSDSKLQKEFSGLVGDVALAYRFASGTTFRLGGRRVVDFSIYTVNPYVLNTTFELRAVHYLTRAFGLEAGASQGTVDYPTFVIDPGSSAATSSLQINRVDLYRLWDVGVRLRLSENQIGRRVEFSLKYENYNLDTSVDDRCSPFQSCAYRDQNRAAIGFGATFGY